METYFEKSYKKGSLRNNKDRKAPPSSLIVPNATSQVFN